MKTSGSNDARGRTFAERYEQALRIAAVVHVEHSRKGTRIPYITHVVHVSRLLQEHGAPEAVVLAGLLHDVLEDADDDARTRERLTAVFPGFEAGEGLDALLGGLRALIDGEVGEEVRHLAQAVSEEKVEDGESRPWKTRKLEQLAHLRGGDAHVALLKAADTLHNVTAIADDVSVLGWSVLQRFNAGPADLLWYYGSVVELVSGRSPVGSVLVEQLRGQFERLTRVIEAATARDADARAGAPDE